MEFRHDDETTTLQTTLRGLFSDRSPGSAARAAEASMSGWDSELWRVLSTAGMVGVTIDESQGGQGGKALHETIVAEEAGRATAVVPLLESARSARILAESDTQAANAALRRLISGDEVVIPIDGNIAAEGRGRLYGSAKVVPYATAASLFVVRAANGDSFLLRSDAEGVLVRRQPALGPAPIGAVVFDSARAELLRKVSWHRADVAEELGAVAWAAGGTGGVLEYAVDYARIRRQFGRPIGSFQAVQHRLADAACSYEQSRLLALAAAEEADRQREARRALDAALVVCLDGYRRASAAACQVLGGYGFMLEYDAQLHFRAAKTLRLLFPSAEPLRRLGMAAVANARATADFDRPQSFSTPN